jgi:hypothetical protein
VTIPTKFPTKYNDPCKCNDPLESSNLFALQKPKLTPGITIQLADSFLSRNSAQAQHSHALDNWIRPPNKNGQGFNLAS